MAARSTRASPVAMPIRPGPQGLHRRQRAATAATESVVGVCDRTALRAGPPGRRRRRGPVVVAWPNHHRHAAGLPDDVRLRRALFAAVRYGGRDPAALA